jgi:hypothetical protein
MAHIVCRMVMVGVCVHRPITLAKLRLLAMVSSVVSVANTFVNKNNRQNIMFQRFVYLLCFQKVFESVSIITNP